MSAVLALPNRPAEARAALADLFARHERAFLAFSGGKEGLALAKLCEPWKGRFRLLWSNTGFTYPHVEELVRRYGEQLGLEEVRGNLPAAWRTDGLPSDVVAVRNLLPSGAHDAPKLQTWISCCARVRLAPLHDFLQRQDAPTLVLHGQRHEDRAPGLGMSSWPLPAHVEVVAPLAGWSTADVFAFLAAERVEMPEQYAEVSDSLDCWICPAGLATPIGAQRAAFLARRYPNLLQTVLPGARRARDAARVALGHVERAITAAEEGAGNVEAPAVLQFEPSAGDCVVAALATALGRSYADVASILRVELEPATGRPVNLEAVGIDITAIGADLLAAGIAATLLSPPVVAGMGVTGLRTVIQGRPAILVVEVEHDGRREPHALAWTGRRLIDCRGPVARDVQMHRAPILATLVLTHEAHP